MDSFSDQPKFDFYQRMRQSIRTWVDGKGRDHKYADYLLFAPDLLHVLCKLAMDGQVPLAKKAKLAGVIAYFISPADAVPEGIVGPAVYLDDVALAAYALNDIINEVGPEILQKHWAGSEDVLEVIQKILSIANEILGGGLWNQTKRMFGFGRAGLEN